MEKAALKGIPARFAPVKERLAFGKSRRRALPRSDQGRWTTWMGRPDTLATLLEASHGRLPELLPIKWGRMVASPFGFFRGAVPVMALDLARLPVTGAHARTGDAAILYGYCGDTNRLDRAMERFAIAYADQTESDHAAFVKAIKAGKIQARRGI